MSNFYVYEPKPGETTGWKGSVLRSDVNVGNLVSVNVKSDDTGYSELINMKISQVHEDGTVSGTVLPLSRSTVASDWPEVPNGAVLRFKRSCILEIPYWAKENANLNERE